MTRFTLVAARKLMVPLAALSALTLAAGCANQGGTAGASTRPAFTGAGPAASPAAVLPAVSSADALVGEGLRLLQQGHTQEARVKFQAALNADNAHWRAWNALGLSYDLTQSWAQAADAYQHARRAGGDESEISNNEGASLLMQRRFAEAETAFRQTLVANPQHPAANANLQLALAGQGRYEEAASNGATPAVLNNVGYMALTRGDLHTAEAYLTRAVQASPSYYATASGNLERVQRMLDRSGNTPANPAN